MKKLFGIFLVLLLAVSTIYALDDDDNERSFGATASARLSILGLTPEVSLIVNNFEIGGCAQLISGKNFDTGEETFGIGAGGFLGFAQAPFSSGYKSGVGLQYLWLPSNYLKSTLFSELFKNTLSGVECAHILSLYYRGTVKFNDLIGLTFRIALPLYAGFTNSEYVSIISSTTGWICWLMAPCSFSLGIRFEF
ncbi:MAG: hypothetical protein K6C97_09115 [Treponema sp.]|nr:hypothetical protein [Treponema sp.]